MPDHRIALGSRIREHRLAADLKLGALRDRLRATGLATGTSVQNLSQIELGSSWPSKELVRALDSIFATNGELLHLLREAKVPTLASDGSDVIVVTAHLFYPLHVDDVPEPRNVHDSDAFDFVPRLGRVGDSGFAALHLFPFDVVVLHEAHELVETDLAMIASWRRAQISRCPTATIDHLAELGLAAQSLDHAPYCFSAFVVNRLPWTDDQVQGRAIQILAMPGVLESDLDASGGGHRATALLHSATPIGDVIEFSLSGSHFGAASWAAVAVFPTSVVRDIERALIEFEIQLQAIWCYASNVAERGAFVSYDFDGRFLRQVLGRLQRPWPTEHTAVRRLREALLQTSRITDLVHCAIEATGDGQGAPSK